MLETLIDLLVVKKLTLSTCESCTGGYLAALITEIPSVSRCYVGSIVTYATRIKSDVVHVDSEIIQKYGVISEETAKEMAIKTNVLMKSDVCISFSGNAGPGVMEDKPVGVVCYAISYKNHCLSFTSQYLGSRQEIKNAVIVDAVNECIQLILGK